MRIIKALLVLVFLLPTLAAAQPTPEFFIRIERGENREPVALQTAIAKYVPVGSATESRLIWSPSSTSASKRIIGA